MRFRPEPVHQHGRPARTAVLVVNLGSPAEPTPAAVRRYLAEFLGDPRVVEIPRAAWWPILHGIILRTRPRRSASKYASIWTPEGSPLAVGTARLATLLKGFLGEAGMTVLVRHAMRYGQPAVHLELDALKAEGATRILVLPLYPQYAAATTASIWDVVSTWAARTRNLPELRLVRSYADDAGYIRALGADVRAHWAREGRGQMLVMSFHGLPRRSLELGDPYHCECLKTGRLLAQELGLADSEFRITFQSRFGRTPWLEPYTQPTLEELGAGGVRRVDVICPGFAVDCLETLEEVAQEAQAAFIAAGGQEFHYIPCLNDSHGHVKALMGICQRHLQGWPIPGPAPTPDDQRSRAAALERGAPR
jgi:protoporphyrin/coproporphyrin ferrochelatase